MNNEVLTFNTAEDKVYQEQIKIYNLVPENDPILLEALPEFDFDNPEINPTELASALVETCKMHKGLGLSANQCGLRYRVFVMGYGDEYVAFFNPKILHQSDEVVHMQEGCLSFPQLFLNITRPSTVSVEYQDYNGNDKKAVFTGMTARCFLHEYDHLSGITFTTRAKPLALKSGNDKRKKLFSSMEKVAKKIGKLAKKR